jgi:hypothetical protein
VTGTRPKLQAVPEDSNHGAYGFRIVPIDRSAALPHLTRVDGDAPRVGFQWGYGVALHDAREVGPDVVCLSGRRAGSITVRREPPRAAFVVPQPLPPAAIVHPLGTLPLSVLAHWRGDVTLHGGAFLHGAGAWGVCGDRSAGKSTTLALIAERGITIVADDLLAIQGLDALAGPRCVDLRADAASRFASARSLGRVGARIRYRLPTAAAPARVPLRGIFLLEWTAETATELTLLTPRERIALLYKHQYSSLFRQPDGRRIMALLDLPMLRFRRPRGWDRAGDAIDRLIAAAEAH